MAKNKSVITVVLERRDGKTANIDDIESVLPEGYKLIACGHGDHLLSAGALRHADEALDAAKRMLSRLTLEKT